MKKNYIGATVFNRKRKGLGLIEMMLVLLVGGVLLAMTVTAYKKIYVPSIENKIVKIDTSVEKIENETPSTNPLAYFITIGVIFFVVLFIKFDNPQTEEHYSRTLDHSDIPIINSPDKEIKASASLEKPILNLEKGKRKVNV